MRKSNRIIWVKDGYHTIYKRIVNNEKLFYFLEWNKKNISSIDIIEEKMFDSNDLNYIKQANEWIKNWIKRKA